MNLIEIWNSIPTDLRDKLLGFTYAALLAWLKRRHDIKHRYVKK